MGISPSSPYRWQRRPDKQCKAVGSHKDRSLLGHPSASRSFPSGLQVTWHHAGVAAICSLQLFSSIVQLGVSEWLSCTVFPSLRCGAEGCHRQHPLMNCQLLEKAEYNFLARKVAYQSCKVTRKSRGPCFVTNTFSFWDFTWSSGAQLALNVKPVQSYPDSVKHVHAHSHKHPEF